MKTHNSFFFVWFSPLYRVIETVHLAKSIKVDGLYQLPPLQIDPNDIWSSPIVTYMSLERWYLLCFHLA